MHPFRFFLNLCLVSGISVWTGLAAFAYVLEGPHILDLMVKTLGRTETLAVSAKIDIHQPSREGAVTTLDATIRLDASGRSRVEVSGYNGQCVRVRSHGRIITLVDGQIIPSAESMFDRYLDILSIRSRKTLHERLMALGVDVSVTSIGRYDNQPVFVMGANYPDMSRNQIWIDKETFLPLRFLEVTRDASGGGKTMDVVYGNWQKTGDTRYPMTAHMYRDQKLIRSVRVRKVEENKKMDGSIFDVEQMLTLYPTVSDHNLFVDQPHPFEEEEMKW